MKIIKQEVVRGYIITLYYIRNQVRNKVYLIDHAGTHIRVGIEHTEHDLNYAISRYEKIIKMERKYEESQKY